MPTLLVEPEIYTQEDLEQLSAEGAHYELIRGELKPMSPAGGGHGSVTMYIAALVSAHVISNDLGVTFAAETGFIAEENPRTILAPDFAFIARPRVPVPMPGSYVPVVPDLVLETRSPGDTAREVAAKIELWLEVGASVVWELNPRRQILTVYRPNAEPLSLTADDVLTSALLPGFSLELSSPEYVSRYLRCRRRVSRHDYDSAQIPLFLLPTT